MRWSDVPGWLTDGQAQLLQRYASEVPDNRWVVEIGSHQGRSTVVLASCAEKVLAVDPWANDKWGGNETTFDQFEKNLDGCGVSATAFHGTSVDAAAQFDGEIGMLYIDGAHDLESVLHDIDDWRRFLAPDAIVCLHDAFSSIGVTQAVLTRYLGSKEFRYLESSRSLIAFRHEPVAVGARIASTARLSSRLPWFAWNLVVKVAIRYVLAPALSRRRLPVPQMPY